MAIVTVTERMHRRRGSKDAKETKYTRVFQVATDLPDTGPAAVLVATDPTTAITIPVVNEEYIPGAAALCRSIEATPEGDDGMLWQVVAQYSIPIAGTWTEVHPLSRPMEVYWDFQRTQEECFVDAITDAEHPNGHPILNAAFEAFDPPVMMDVSRPVLTMVRNEAAFDVASAMAAQDVVNNSLWPTSGGPGAPAGTAKIASVTGQKVHELWGGSEITFYGVTYRLEFKHDGWRVWIVNQGFRYWGQSELVDPDDPTQGFYKKWFEFKDADGNPASMPQYLNPDGTELVLLNEGSGTPPALPTEQQIYWKEFQIYREGTFGGIPNPYLEFG